MKVFILGGTGFLGYYTTLELIRRGHTVRTLALPPLPAGDLLPPEVEILLGDFNQLGDVEVLNLFRDCDGVVFAAGVDDRVTPKAPAYPFFHKANVHTAERFFQLAKAAGAKRGVLLSSYFAHFGRVWPEMQLTEHHPYIRSRVEQERVCLEVAGEDLDLMILELPYIFGRMPGRTPLWKPIVDYLHWPLPWLFYTRGGTSMISVEKVAQGIVGALEVGESGRRYLIGDENLTWGEFFERLGAVAGVSKRVVTLPDVLVLIGLWSVKLLHLVRGLEGGLKPGEFLKLQTRETFFDVVEAQKALGFEGGGLDEAFRETIRGCGYEI
jgi:nucleoside-diphosphate-sugar epimerase